MPQVKIYENQEVIVWDYRLDPGERSGIHTHDLDYCFVVTNEAQLQEFDAKGHLVPSSVFLKKGNVFAFTLSEDGTMLIEKNGACVPQPATHEAVNVGETVYKQIAIEFKKQIPT